MHRFVALAGLLAAVSPQPAHALGWTEHSSQNTACNQVHFFSASVGVLVSPKLRETQDGGKTWTDMTQLGSFWTEARFHFFDSLEGLAFAGNPVKSQTKA